MSPQLPRTGPRIGLSMGNDPLGWMIIVQLPGGSSPQVYNVAIPDERQAIDAVKQVLPVAEGTMIKVKSELLERVYKALKMRPGDVLVGARRRERKTRLQNQA
jgi:hypothetical protein